MRTWGAVCVLIAACSEPRGLTLDVVGDDRAERVELFLGRDCEGTCPGSVRPPGLPSLDATLFLIDDDKTWTKEIVDGVAGFRIESGEEDTHVPVLVAIGFEGATPVSTAYARDLTIPKYGAIYGKLVLQPADPIVMTDVPPPDGTVRMKLWRANSEALPSCVALERWNGGAPERAALGPVLDTDCDDVTLVPECAPWSYRAAGQPASIDQADCTRIVPVGTNADVCMAAGPTCNELNPGGATCAALDEDYCMASVLCACGEWDVTCLSSRLAMSASGAGITCVIPTDTAGAPCVDPTLIYAVDLRALLGNTSSQCASVRLHELAPTIGPFDRAVFGSSLLKVANLYEPCMVELEWKGPGPTAVGNQPVMALASLDLVNGKHLVVPMVLQFARGQCAPSLPATCAAHAGDPLTERMSACAGPAIPASACLANGSCSEGPPCGATCCNVGEHCVNNECRCGAGPKCDATNSSCQFGPYAPCGSTCCNGPGEPQCEF